MSNVNEISKYEAGLGFRAEDFLASPAAMTSRIGGLNPHSIDCTVVMNMPPCPCAECQGKNQMVPMWGYPSRQEALREVGIIPVPPQCFDNNYNGGRPVRSVSPYAVVRDGRMIREPGACEVMLYFTTCSTYARLQRLEAEAVALQQLGRSQRGQRVGAPEADADARRIGMTPEEDHGEVIVEQVRKSGNDVSRTKRPLTVAMPGKEISNGPPNF